jgi:hypothetical protein
MFFTRRVRQMRDELAGVNEFAAGRMLADQDGGY